MSLAATLAGTAEVWAGATLLCGAAMLAGCLALGRASGHTRAIAGSTPAADLGRGGGVVAGEATPSPRRVRAGDATARIARQATEADESWVFASATPFAALRLAGHSGDDVTEGELGGAARRAGVAAIGQGLPVVLPRESHDPGRMVAGSFVAVPLLDEGVGALVVAVSAGLRRTDRAVIDALLAVAEDLAARRARTIHRLPVDGPHAETFALAARRADAG